MARVDSESVRRLETLLRQSMPRFQDLFRRKYQRDVFDPGWSIIPVRTCYINGKGKGYKVPDWPGVFDAWAKSLLPGGKVFPEAWYRVDAVVAESSDCNWYAGRYQLLLAFEQENNPAEVKGHTRQFYDLNIPDKVLLVWTNNAQPDNQAVLAQVCEVVAYCRDHGIRNCGQITVIVGDWDRLAEACRSGADSGESVLVSRTIPSELP